MNTIQLKDLQTLSNDKFVENGENKKNNHLLGLKWIKTGSTWRQELITIKRQDVSCWPLFLSIFGLGELKHTSISLDKMCSHLSKYQWKEITLEISPNPKDNLHENAFKTVCHLANRQIQRHKFQLFKEVSHPMQGGFNHYWNPAMNGRFLLSLQRYRLPHAKNVELRFKDSKALVAPNKILNIADMVNIEVGFKYELIAKHELDDSTSSYYYPLSPYYSTQKDKTKQLPRRREL